MNLYKKFLGAALGVGLTGAAVGALAQTSTQQNNTPPPAQSEKQTTGNSQSCPMMNEGQMDVSKMDMPKMMDCCKKMGMMKSDRPAEVNKDNLLTNSNKR